MAGVLAAAISSYRLPPVVKTLIELKPPLILAGVTAAGKNTVCQHICTQDQNFERLITYTTRPPRGSEQPGKDYWFLDEGQMFEYVKRQVLMEAQNIHDFSYGSPIEGYLTIARRRLTPILTVDVNGAAQLSRLKPRLRPYFLLPPSFEEWMRRLGGRDFLSDGERNRRLHSAADEISAALADPSFVLVISDDVSQTAKDVTAGLVGSPASQAESRKVAEELQEYIKNQ